MDGIKSEKVKKLIVSSYMKRRLEVEGEPLIREKEEKTEIINEEFIRVHKNIYSPVSIE